MRVLFLGNSYTFYNDVPGQVRAMALESGTAMDVDQVVEGGADWSMHAGRLGGLAKIATGVSEAPWDIVVLQGRSTDPLLKRRRFHKFGKLLGEAAQKAGARVVLYQTWAWARDHGSYAHRWTKRSPEGWLNVVRDEYVELGHTLSAEVAPAGDAWAKSLAKHPELELYDDDRHHASPLGSHLSACVLARTLLRIDPCKIEWHPEDVPPGVSAKLKSIAAEI